MVSNQNPLKTSWLRASPARFSGDVFVKSSGQALFEKR
jgi:hypothetical protein